MRLLLLFTLICTLCLARRVKRHELPAHYFAPPLKDAQTAGTNFLFTFINSHLSANDTSYTESLSLTVTNPSASDATVTIQSSYAQFVNFTVTVAAGQSKLVDIKPVDIQVDYMDKYFGYLVMENKAITVSSSVPVSLVASNYRSGGAGGDKYTIFPTCMLGNNYHMVGDESVVSFWSVNSTNILSITPTQDNTTVTVTELLAKSYTIHRGTTMTIATDYVVNDVIITSSAPVSVVSGAVCGFGYYNPRKCSFESVMLYPTNNWDTTVPFFKYLPEEEGEYLVTIKEDNTVIYIDGKAMYWSNLIPFSKDEYLLENTTTGAVITASKPIYVNAVGSTNSVGNSAPFFAHVPAPRNFISDHVTFATGLASDEASFTHYVRIVTYINYIGHIILDNYTPNALIYRRMGFGDYYFVDLDINAGQHTVKAPPGNTFCVTVYGYGPGESYAFTPGLDLQANGTC